MRASTNGISSVRFAFGFQPASSCTCPSVTFLPSQLRSTDSSTMRIETGSLSSFRFSFFARAGSECSLPCLNDCRVSNASCGITASVVDPQRLWAAGTLLFQGTQFADELRPFLQQRRQVQVAARDGRGIGADLGRE